MARQYGEKEVAVGSVCVSPRVSVRSLLIVKNLTPDVSGFLSAIQPQSVTKFIDPQPGDRARPF